MSKSNSISPWVTPTANRRWSRSPEQLATETQRHREKQKEGRMQKAVGRKKENGTFLSRPQAWSVRPGFSAYCLLPTASCFLRVSVTLSLTLFRYPSKTPRACDDRECVMRA